MPSTRRSIGRPVRFPAALLLGAVAEAAVVAAFAGTSVTAYRGVPGALGLLIAVAAGILAGPLAGVLLALAGGIGFVVFVTDGQPEGWVAVVVWVIAAGVAGGIADRYRLARQDREYAYAAEQRARRAAEIESTRLRQLHDLTGRLATAMTVQDVGEALVDTVIGSLSPEASAVALLSADGAMLEVVASRGYPDQVVERWSTMPVMTPVILADAIATRSVVTVGSGDEALERYPVLAGLGTGYPLGAQAAAPLLAGEVLLGVIGVNFAESKSFTSEDVSLLLAIGWQGGQAIERARLFEAEREAREHMAELRELASALAAGATPGEIAHIAVERVFRILGGRGASIRTLMPDRRTIELVTTHGFTTDQVRPYQRVPIEAALPPAEAIREGRTILIRSPEELMKRYPSLAPLQPDVGDQSWAVLPLKSSGHILGSLSVTFAEPQAFDDGRRAELEAVADQVALALERSLLQQSREEAAFLSARVERIKAVSGAMSPSLGVGEVAAAIITEAAEALGATAGGLGVATADRRTIEFISRIGSQEQMVSQIPVDEPGPTTEAFRTGAVVRVEREQAWRRRYPGGSSALGEPTRSVLAVPISAGGDRIGAISLGFEQERTFSADELRFVQALADEAGEALERARLFEAEQHALRRAARLQEVTARLARAVTTEEAVRAILRAATGGVEADAASIALADDDGRSLSAVPGQFVRGTLQLQPPIEMPVTERGSLQEVYRRGSPLWISSAEAWRDGFPDGFARLGHLGRCLYAVPIVARGVPIGALAVYFEDERPELSTEDAELIGSFAHQAGIALERARTYEAEHEAAITLQRNLMPEDISPRTHVQASGRYLPATRGVHVGGDWYDVVDRPDGSVAFAIGDIAGHGLQAAAAMGQVRSAWRALALSMTDPSAILGSLDRYAKGVDGAFFSTILTMLLDPSTNRLRYASAGHPPALMIEAHGGTTFLEGGRSVPLGLPFDLPRPHASTTLPHGAVLVLFTDGLVERRDESLDRGLERLAAAASTAAVGGSLDQISNTLLELVAEDRHDDVALLTIGASPLADVFRRTFPADASELATMRAELRAWLERSGLSEVAREDVVLACTEAAANAIEHAYIGRRGEVHVIVESKNGGLQLSVSDDGRWRDPRPDEARGRGLDLVRALMGNIEVDRGEAGTTVRLRVEVS